MRRAHLYGDWDAMAGQYFREFSRQRHVIAPFELPRWWRRFRSMDWGYNDPCCVLWHAVDGDGRVYTYRELYVRQRRADQVAQSIIKLSGDEEISYTVASPDMWQKRGAILKGDGFEGESLAELFARGGVPLASADNARIAGWQRVRGYMADGADGPCGRRLIAAKTLYARCQCSCTARTTARTQPTARIMRPRRSDTALCPARAKAA